MVNPLEMEVRTEDVCIDIVKVSLNVKEQR